MDIDPFALALYRRQNQSIGATRNNSGHHKRFYGYLSFSCGWPLCLVNNTLIFSSILILVWGLNPRQNVAKNLTLIILYERFVWANLNIQYIKIYCLFYGGLALYVYERLAKKRLDKERNSQRQIDEGGNP